MITLYDKKSVDVTPAVVFLIGCWAIYLGCRGFQERGIVLWHRSGTETRITGRSGRVVGLLCILIGGFFIWLGLAAVFMA